MSKINDPEYIVKTLIIGDIGVGKSSLMNRIAYPLNSFDPSIPSTIGLEFATYKIVVNHDDEKDKKYQQKIIDENQSRWEKIAEGKSNPCKYKLQIWDCAGHPKFFSIVKSYFRGTQIVMYVFDITKKDTFEALRDWHKAVINNNDSKHVSIVVGNKLDLSKTRKVSTQEGESFAHSINASYIETSAKDFTEVNALFRKPVKNIDLLYHQGQIELQKIKELNQNIRFSKMDNDEEGSGCAKCF